MAANLQIVFYRDGTKDPVLAKILLNEKETLFEADIKPVDGPFYIWSDLYEYLLSVEQKAE